MLRWGKYCFPFSVLKKRETPVVHKLAVGINWGTSLPREMKKGTCQELTARCDLCCRTYNIKIQVIEHSFSYLENHKYQNDRKDDPFQQACMCLLEKEPGVGWALEKPDTRVCPYNCALWTPGSWQTRQKGYFAHLSNLGVGVKESEHSDFNAVAIQGAGTQLWKTTLKKKNAQWKCQSTLRRT